MAVSWRVREEEQSGISRVFRENPMKVKTWDLAEGINTDSNGPKIVSESAILLNT
jgi:hypothetical protein